MGANRAPRTLSPPNRVADRDGLLPHPGPRPWHIDARDGPWRSTLISRDEHDQAMLTRRVNPPRPGLEPPGRCLPDPPMSETAHEPGRVSEASRESSGTRLPSRNFTGGSLSRPIPKLTLKRIKMPSRVVGRIP
jgi:hypothetical protein